MIKTDEQKANEIFTLLDERVNTTFLTDDEIKFVHWLCRVTDEQSHNTFIGMLNKINLK